MDLHFYLCEDWRLQKNGLFGKALVQTKKQRNEKKKILELWGEERRHYTEQAELSHNLSKLFIRA